MTAPPLDSPAAAAAFVGQLPESHRVRLLAALLGTATRAEPRLPDLTPELEAELDGSRRNPGVVLSAQEWIAELKGQAAATERSRTPARGEPLLETSPTSR